MQAVSVSLLPAVRLTVMASMTEIYRAVEAAARNSHGEVMRLMRTAEFAEIGRAGAVVWASPSTWRRLGDRAPDGHMQMVPEARRTGRLATADQEGRAAWDRAASLVAADLRARGCPESSVEDAVADILGRVAQKVAQEREGGRTGGGLGGRATAQGDGRGQQRIPGLPSAKAKRTQAEAVAHRAAVFARVRADVLRGGGVPDVGLVVDALRAGGYSALHRRDTAERIVAEVLAAKAAPVKAAPAKAARPRRAIVAEAEEGPSAASLAAIAAAGEADLSLAALARGLGDWGLDR